MYTNGILSLCLYLTLERRSPDITPERTDSAYDRSIGVVVCSVLAFCSLSPFRTLTRRR
ncbi:hypothetical protein BDM02DRAFT_2753055 [Thelephora ganbajun]|uniref:Uncharacterized protein n=1 Tax=Thelephora ganbajun TaxID=370292 RepID=A0ACB6ZS81_THEGA|nr:hypothetical protein BDM02DRAFT_2753055 [Thelephora ganbajun]